MPDGLSEAEITHPTSSEDWLAMREICCLTARSGEPIDRNRFPFFGEWWIGPYERFSPGFSYIARVDGKIRGYLTAAASTRSFEWKKRWGFDLPLLGKILLGRFPKNGDTERWIRRTWGWEKWPEGCFPVSTRKLLDRDFPAHLHMNVESGFRNYRLGEKLLSRLISDLKTQGVPGIHLHCGPLPLGFYQRHGFRILDQIEYRPGAIVHCLGLPISRAA